MHVTVLILSFPVIHRHVSDCLCFMNWALLRIIRVLFRWQLCDLLLWLLGSRGFAPGPWAPGGEVPEVPGFGGRLICQVLESIFLETSVCLNWASTRGVRLKLHSVLPSCQLA